MKKRILFIPLLCAALQWQNTFGQEAKPEPQISDLYTLSLEELMNITVVTASQSKQNASDAPATIYVITQEQIADRGYATLEELLEDLPEIEIQRKSVAENSNHISLRGISGNEKFMILLNGIRVNSMAGTPHAVTYNYTLSNAKQVEVILGPASALYGADAFSGIINIITRTGAETKATELTSSVGSYKTFYNALSSGYGNDKVSFNITGSHYHSDEPYFPRFYKEEFKWYNENYKTNGLHRASPFAPDQTIATTIKPYETPTNAYYINAALNVNDFQFGYLRNYESHNSSMGMRPDFNEYAKESQYNSIIQTFYVTHNYTSENSKLSIQSNVNQTNYELDPNSQFQNTYTGYNVAYKYAFDNSFFIREQVSYKLAENHSVIGGFSYQYTNALAKTGDLPFKYDKDTPPALQNMYYLGTNTTDQNGNDLTIYQDFYFVEQKNFGSFLQFQSDFGKILKVTAGLRHDYNTRYGNTINPRLGLVVKPTEKLKVKILYGESFLAPSIYNSFQHYGSFQTVDNGGNPTSDPNQTAGVNGPFWHLSNPKLKPQKLHTAEVGLSYIQPTFVLSADAYYNQIRNLITSEVEINQVFRGIDIDFVERPSNRGEAYTYGFTLKADTYHEVGKVKLQGYVIYSYSDGEVDSNPLPFSAKNTIKAGLMAKYKKFSINPRVIFRSKSLHTTEKDEANNPQSNSSFALVNLFAKYTINKNVSLQFKAVNLLNSRYYNVSLGQGESFYATPQDPIRLNFGVNAKF
jgi:outer membrane receptor for ferrienterochelin and colicin